MGWRPKTRPKNKLRLNMKKLLNPKLAQEKITISEDSSSQEDFEEDESLNVKKVKSKKHDSLMVNSSSVKNKILEHLEYFKRKENLSPQQDYSVKHHSVMLASCIGEGKSTEPSSHCNFEGDEYPDIPVKVTKQ